MSYARNGHHRNFLFCPLFVYDYLSLYASLLILERAEYPTTMGYLGSKSFSEWKISRRSNRIITSDAQSLYSSLLLSLNSATAFGKSVACEHLEHLGMRKLSLGGKVTVFRASGQSTDLRREPRETDFKPS